MDDKNSEQSVEELFHKYFDFLMADAELMKKGGQFIEEATSSQSPFPEIANRPPNKAGLYREFNNKFTLFTKTTELYKQMNEEKRDLFSEEYRGLRDMFETYAINLSDRLCDGKKN